MRSRWMPIVATSAGLLLAVIEPVEAAAGATDAKDSPVSGPSFEKALQQPLGVSWTATPLREAIAGLSSSARIAVLLDRRIDPGQPVTLTLDNVPLKDILQQLAENRGLGLSRIGSVVYLGPPAYTRVLRTLSELRRQEARRASGPLAERLLRARSLDWKDLDQPRAILARLAEEAGVTIAGMQQVPHDLWAGARLPALPLVDRVGLIAGQYDLTLALDDGGKGIRLAPQPANPALVASYTVGANADATLERWKKLAPAAHVKRVDDRLWVKGTAEELELIADSMKPGGDRAARSNSRTGGHPAPRSQAEKRFTIQEAKGMLGDLIEKLAQRMGVEVEIDRKALEAAGVSLNQPVSFSVSNADVDGVFQAMLARTGCTFQRRGDVVVVVPAAK